jgi:hypothetical protein
MATQAPEATPTTQRVALTAVTARMLAELRHLWPSLPKTPELQPLLRYEVFPAVVHQYGDAAATLAADWYDAERARLNVPGRFNADIAPQPVEDQLRAISNWATEPLKVQPPDEVTVEMASEAVQKRLESASQKLVADMSRQTVAQSAERDPNARGWARFTDADACAFCLMLTARGGVYTEASVKFGSHDHCHCLAGPVWDENYREWVGEYQRATHRSASQRRAQNKLARRWMKDNLPGVRG